MNQEAHGGAVSADFISKFPEFIQKGMLINGAYYHPTFLYESLWNIVGFLFIVFVLRKLPKLLVGEIAAFYAVWYSIGRYMVEGMRTDSLMLTESIRMANLFQLQLLY